MILLSLADGEPRHPDDLAAGQDDGQTVAARGRDALGPEDLLELLPARGAERPVEVARPPVPDRQREDELGRVEVGAGRGRRLLSGRRDAIRLPHGPPRAAGPRPGGRARARPSQRSSYDPTETVRFLRPTRPPSRRRMSPLRMRQLLAFAERQERFHVVVGDVPEAPGDLAQEFAGDAPGQGGQEEGQGLEVQG